jgi:hypothetical protein
MHTLSYCNAKHDSTRSRAVDMRPPTLCSSTPCPGCVITARGIDCLVMIRIRIDGLRNHCLLEK